MTPLHTTNGKQVLLAGVHFADGASTDAATLIARALNGELARASEMLAFIADLAAMRTETECEDTGDCMLGDDACSALSGLVEEARGLLARELERMP